MSLLSRFPELSGSWTTCPAFYFDTMNPIMTAIWNSTVDGDFSGKLIDIRLILHAHCGKVLENTFSIDASTIGKEYNYTLVSFFRFLC